MPLVVNGYSSDQKHIRHRPTTYMYMYMVEPSINMITSMPCRAVRAVHPLPDVRGRGVASPLTSHVTKGGCTVVALS